MANRLAAIALFAILALAYRTCRHRPDRIPGSVTARNPRTSRPRNYLGTRSASSCRKTGSWFLGTAVILLIAVEKTRNNQATAADHSRADAPRGADGDG